jgi:hypothetical protein
MYIMPNVPTNDSGTATLGITVAQPLRKKTKTTNTTSTTEITMLRSTSLMEARMVVVRSRITCKCIPGGMEACNSGSMS